MSPGITTGTVRVVRSLDELQDRLQLPVALDNDANCAMLAEWRLGAAHGCTDAVLLTIGTGIGSGVVAGGRLVRGATGAATDTATGRPG